MPQARLQPSAPISIVLIWMLPDVATPRLQMKVRAMIRPNKVSEIRSIGSSTRPEGLSETSDIESNAPWLNLQGKFAGYFSSDRQQQAVKTRGRTRLVKCWQCAENI